MTRFYFPIESNNAIINLHFAKRNKFVKSLESDVMKMATAHNSRPESFPAIPVLVFHKHGRTIDTDNFSLCAKYFIDAIRKKGIIKDDGKKQFDGLVILQGDKAETLRDEGADLFYVIGQENILALAHLI